MRPDQVSFFRGLAALGNVIVDLRDDRLLVGRELALGDVAQVGIGTIEELAGRCCAVDGLVVRDDWRNLPGSGVGIGVAFRDGDL